MSNLTTIPMALLASSQIMIAFTPVSSPSKMHEVACTPPLASKESDATADALGATDCALGIVLALDNCHIGLLQLAEDATSHQIVVYQYCDSTNMPREATVGPGDTVIVTYHELPNEPLFATCVQRLPPEYTAATPPVASEIPVAVEQADRPPVVILPIPIKTPPQPSADDPVEQDYALGELPLEEQYPPCPADDEAADKVERFSFGKIVSLVHRGLIVREYDFVQDTDVEAFYELQAETEFGNINSERPLNAGDDVVIDYLDADGRRLVTTIVREDPVEVTGSFPSKESGCCVAEAKREGVWIREY